MRTIECAVVKTCLYCNIFDQLPPKVNFEALLYNILDQLPPAVNYWVFCFFCLSANYIYADATKASKAGNILMYSTRYYPPIYKCLRFWYFMYGTGVGTLRVNIYQKHGMYKEVFRLFSNQGKKWIKATIPLMDLKEDGTLFKVSENVPFSLSQWKPS